MNKYIVRELQQEGAFREGVEVHARSLSQAKRKATALQVFEGTILRIESSHGGSIGATDIGKTLSVKKCGCWIDSTH